MAGSVAVYGAHNSVLTQPDGGYVTVFGAHNSVLVDAQGVVVFGTHNSVLTSENWTLQELLDFEAPSVGFTLGLPLPS